MPTFPLLHGNGSSFEQLYAQYTEARNGLWYALEALTRSEPHERDYCLQGGYEEARRAHVDRLDRVRTSLEEIDAIRMALSDQLED